MPRKERAQLATQLFDELDRRCNAKEDGVGTISHAEVAFLRQAYAEAMTRDNSVSLVSCAPPPLSSTALICQHDANSCDAPAAPRIAPEPSL